MKKLVVLFGIVLAVLIGCKTGTILSNDKILVVVFEPKAIALLLVLLPLKMMVVTMVAKLKGLTPGVHAIHIHENQIVLQQMVVRGH
jgi:Cu-Zn family superoxide dismutase